MNTISFKTTEDFDEDGVGWEHTDLIIDGKSLFERLEEYEVSEAKRTKTDVNLAGKYIGIDPQDLFKTLNGGSSTEFHAWQCSICRSSLCSSQLTCKYKVGLFSVELYDFRQVPKPSPFNSGQGPHPETAGKVKWNYGAFGPFKFNRNAFFKEVRSLRTT